MAWNSLEFMDQLKACGNRYELENEWYRKDQWGDQHKYALNAWKLYQKARTNELGMLLLGDGKIRKDSPLMASFGITTVGGAWDPDEKRLVAKLEAERKQLRAAPGLRDAPAVQGQGSILSEVHWTPLLNDCYILGGAHGGHEFHLALEDVGAGPDAPSLAKLFAALRSPDPTARWLEFFNAQPGVFWDARFQSPRVLVRELIGLKMCGYGVQLKHQQLSFVPPRGAVATATFASYLDRLVSEGYRRKNRMAVMNTLSLFLFQRPNALRA